MRPLLKLCLVLPVALAAASAASADDWQTLFDGKSLSAFRCYNKPDIPAGIWVIENGTLKTVPGVKDGCDLITRDKYKDFEFELEWKVPVKGNSGIIYKLVEQPGKPSYYSGPEMQILDDEGHKDGLDPRTSSGSLYALKAPVGKTLNPPGQWNKSRIVVKGSHVEHWLNDKKVVEYEWNSPEIKAAIAGSKFKAWPEFMKADEGYIAIQHHGEEAYFRNIRVRKL